MKKRLTLSAGCLSLALVAADGALAQMEITGTTGLRPQERDLPTDQNPAFTFVNKTGTTICDFIIAVTVGGADVTGALLDDPNNNAEDWDVDDNGNGTLDPPAAGPPPVPGESVAPPAGAGGEGAGPAALGHPDNTQPPRRSIRIEEVGLNHCVERNRPFEISLSLSAVPNVGDKISLQPTNGRGRNLYAWVGPLENEQRFAVLLGDVLKPTFAAIGFQEGVLVAALQLKPLTTGTKFTSIETTPKGKVSLEEGMVSFATPVDGAKGVSVEATLSDFGVVAVSAQLSPKGRIPKTEMKVEPKTRGKE